MWVDAVGSMDLVLRWHQFAGQETAAEFMSGGITEPDDAQRWLDAGFLAIDAAKWNTAQLDQSEAHCWMTAGLSHAQAIAWAGLTRDPEMAKEWMAMCPGDPGTASLWAEAGVTSPSRAAELTTIGLTARSHAALAAAGQQHADYEARLRTQAARHAGLDVAEDGTLLLDVSTTEPTSIPRRLEPVLAAAAEAGERSVRVRHGAPRLSPESVRQLPEARFVRGASKAAVLRFGWRQPESTQFRVAADGAHSEFAVEVSEFPSEFIHLIQQVTL